MTGFAKRPEGDGYYGPLRWIPAEKHFFFTEPVEDGDGFTPHEVGVGKFKMILDPQNFRRAWIGYVKPTGEGENKKSGGVVLRGICRVYEELCPKPSEAGLALMNDGFASGILFRAVLDASLGGARKECVSSQACMWPAMEKFYELWLAEKDEHPGLLPVAALVGIGKYLTAKGAVPEPVFEIVDWMARPDILPDAPAGTRGDPRAVVQKQPPQQRQLRLVNGPPHEMDDGPPEYLDEPPYDPEYDDPR